MREFRVRLKMKQVSVLMPHWMHKALEESCAKRAMAKGTMVRLALHSFLENDLGVGRMAEIQKERVR